MTLPTANSVIGVEAKEERAIISGSYHSDKQLVVALWTSAFVQEKVTQDLYNIIAKTGGGTTEAHDGASAAGPAVLFL